MKKLQLICPKCNSKNAREYGKKDIHFFDDLVYEVLRNEFGDNADCENYYTAECICDNCNNHFDVKVIIDVKVVEVRYSQDGIAIKK